MNLGDEEKDRLVEEVARRAIDQARASLTGTVGYIGICELAALIDCKPNQRTKMIKWLTENRWKFEVSSAGVPKVARAYHDRKMGIVDGPVLSQFATEPDREAFANRPRGRRRDTV